MSAAWSTKAIFPGMLRSSAPDALSPRKSLQTQEVQPDTCIGQCTDTKVSLGASLNAKDPPTLLTGG